MNNELMRDENFIRCSTMVAELLMKYKSKEMELGGESKEDSPPSFCIHSKNKPPAMQVCSQTALASSKKPPCYNEYKVRQPNHYNKEESKWTIIVYHTQNGHANII